MEDMACIGQMRNKYKNLNQNFNRKTCAQVTGEVVMDATDIEDVSVKQNGLHYTGLGENIMAWRALINTLIDLYIKEDAVSSSEHIAPNGKKRINSGKDRM